MSTILRALDVAKEVGTCWYRPSNGDIIVNPNTMPTLISSFRVGVWIEQDVKRYYLKHSERWVENALMGISIDDSGEMTLSVYYDEDTYKA
jgi:hypothetical protein